MPKLLWNNCGIAQVAHLFFILWIRSCHMQHPVLSCWRTLLNTLSWFMAWNHHCSCFMTSGVTLININLLQLIYIFLLFFLFGVGHAPDEKFIPAGSWNKLLAFNWFGWEVMLEPWTNVCSYELIRNMWGKRAECKLARHLLHSGPGGAHCHAANCISRQIRAFLKSSNHLSTPHLLTFVCLLIGLFCSPSIFM